MATQFNLDPSHSEVTFKVKHLMISNVKGEFKSFDVDVQGDDLETAKVKVTIDAASINTNNADRDTHLKSGDFFEVEKFPTIVFESTGVTKEDDDEYIMTGNLTIRDVTKPVELEIEPGGSSKDPWGNEKYGYSVEGKIDRNEFGLTWNAALETGGVLVSDTVKFYAEIQMVKTAAVAAE